MPPRKKVLAVVKIQLEAAKKQVAGTARSMGIKVAE